MIALIKKHGKGCYMYTADLSRAYRQLRSCPLDWPFLGIKSQDLHYTDTSIPFGLRWGAACMQRTSQAVCHLLHQEGHDSMVYIDDYTGVSGGHHTATQSAHRLSELLNQLGLEEAVEKATPPTTKLDWIGVTFDSVAMTASIPKSYIQDTLELLGQWRNTTQATRHQIQQVLGKLFHVAKCCPPARLFVGRMLHTLRTTPPQGSHPLPPGFIADVDWFLTFLPTFNGILLIRETREEVTVNADACLLGGGAICQGEAYRSKFPNHIRDAHLSISHLELLNVTMAVKKWAHTWEGKRVNIRCDNSAAVATLNSGASRDLGLLAMAREVWYLQAKFDFTINPIHVPGILMGNADALSRSSLNLNYKRRADLVFTALGVRECLIPSSFYNIKEGVGVLP
jgi:hypothetical protein